MCGIVGVACERSLRPSIGAGALARMRDLMIHRGPDGSGLIVHGSVGLAHRRLAVIDPSPAGAQPMETPDGRHAIVYNGELYNDAELRPQLERQGARFISSCDAETVLWALALWGEAAPARLRGMFAFAWHDRIRHRLTLARDPLGIKPLYFWIGPAGGKTELVFASEIPAILDHPHVPVRPDPVGVSAYLTTIRTSLDGRTMFEGVRAVRPGECIGFDLTRSDLPATTRTIQTPPTRDGESVSSVIEDSVRRHLRADVPACSLLSGGLDSTIIVRIARNHDRGLHTYCAGTPCDEPDNDLRAARAVADTLGLAHTSVEVSSGDFTRRWPEMVGLLGLPLSTPNEVAINAIARRIRSDGRVVALSGEGADELFAGYDRPLAAARAAFTGATDAPAEALATLELEQNSWVPPSIKRAMLNDRAWGDLGADSWLVESTRAAFDAGLERASARSGNASERAVRAMLDYHRRVNLVGLLGRLDTATMLASVEGRTPFADVAVLANAESLPTERLISWNGHSALTKVALREAFRGRIPAIAAERAKASFPLPFQQWLGPFGDMVRSSSLLREVFTPAALEAIASRPIELWRLSWPMINLAMWGRRWWGREKARRPEQAPGVVGVEQEVSISGGDGPRPGHRARATRANSGTG